jgi:hypothetical protein
MKFYQNLTPSRLKTTKKEMKPPVYKKPYKKKPANVLVYTPNLI